MNHKTFNTRDEATKYEQEINEQGGCGVSASLGDKYRVYFQTKDEIENCKKLWVTPYNPIRHLKDKAREAKDAITEALTIKKSLEPSEHDVFNDYETIIDIARIMIKYHELDTAKDVLDFVDHTDKYEKTLRQIIEDNFEQYDYEAKEEIAHD